MATITRELLDRRTARSKFFETDTQDEYVAQLYPHDVHYRDVSDSGWFERSELWENVAGGRMWKSKDFEYGVANGSITLNYKGRSLTMKPSFVGMVDATAPGTRNRKLADANYSDVSWNGRTVTVTNIYPNTNLVVRFSDQGFRKEFVISQKPNLPDPSSLGWDASKTYLVFAWDVTKPDGAVVRDAVTSDIVSNGYVGKNDLLIQNAQGDTIFTFPAGTAESSNVIASRRSGPVWYLSLGAQVPFGEAIPYSRAMVATYPLTVDPTTTIYGADSADDGSMRTGNYGTGVWTTGPTEYTYSYYDPGSDPWWDDKSGTWVGGSPPSSDNYQLYFRFSLSGIPVGATCSDASLNLRYSSGVANPHTVQLLSSDWVTLDLSDANISQSSAVTTAIQTSAYTSFALNTTHIASRFGGVAAFRLYEPSDYGQYTYWYMQEASGTSTDPYLSVTYSAVTGWISPPVDGENEPDNTPTLNFSTAVKAAASHFQIQLDTANTFDTGNLRSIRSDVDATGFEYFDGSTWVALTTGGMPAAKTGNVARYTPTTPLAYGVWYRRLRQR